MLDSWENLPNIGQLHMNKYTLNSSLHKYACICIERSRYSKLGESSWQISGFPGPRWSQVHGRQIHMPGILQLIYLIH